jgi:AcrR family transcriptional regulator
MNINKLEKPALRSQPTRDRILEAARLIFGRDGYDHATIRSIAAQADINPAMVMRYYGNKERLFAAVTEAKPDISAFDAVPKSRLGEHIVRKLLEAWESPDTAATRRAILLTAISNETARAKFMGQSQDSYLELLQRFGSANEVGSAAALIASQVMGLVMMRYILRVPTVVAQSREYLIREVGRALQGYMRNI